MGKDPLECIYIINHNRVRSATHVISKEEFAIKIIDKEKVKKEDLVESLKKEI